MRHTPTDEPYFLVWTLAANFADGHRITPHAHDWGVPAGAQTAQWGGTTALIARRFGLGIRTVQRGFIEETGLSLGRCRRHARLMHALRRLGAGASVKSVALESGDRTPSAFVAAFRASLNTTPGRYFDDGRRA
jgi:AraC-like DNA-binding protein